MESFRFVLRGDIGDDNAATFNVELGIAQSLEETDAGLGNQRDQRRIVEVIAVVDVIDVDGNFS